jgi:hypothetical protein
VLRGSAGPDVFTINQGFVGINALSVGYSNVEQLVFEGGAGNDFFALGSVNAGATLVLDGGVGDDTYQISDVPVNTTILDSKGTDTLDFSYAASGVKIDLGKSSGQNIFSNGHKLTITCTIENVIGTDSADWIKGNSANNIILGGGGNDYLDGGPGRNLLIGGAGADTLKAGSGGDLLIGGTTNYDDKPAALAAIMSEWTSARSFRRRSDRLAAGFNDPVAEWIQLGKDTVFDDSARDDLFGGSGSDWFFGFPLDVVHGRYSNDR